MKTLFLLRHAKSSWDDAALPDHDRPLTTRGKTASSFVADHVGRTAVRPALVLCSSARRARDTLDIVEPALGEGVTTRVEENLYGASAAALLDRLKDVDAGIPSVMLVGHNPGLHDLATELAGDGEEGALTLLRTGFPTATLATLELSLSEWSDLDWGQAYLTSVVVPHKP